MNFIELLDKLEVSIPIYKDEFYQQILIFLLKKYKKLKKSVCILDCEISKNGHFVELKNNDSFFFELNFNQKDIHLIINHFEEMFFFDDTNFRLNYQNIFNKIFDGNYKIIESSSYFSTYTKLYFNDEIEKMDNDILTIKNKSYNVIQGESLIDT